MPIIFAAIQIKDYLKNQMYLVRSDFFLFVVAPIIFSYLFFLSQKQKLKFIQIDMAFTSTEVFYIFHKIALENGWAITQHTHNIIIAKTPFSFKSGSWGEQVTLLIDKDKIYLNSICDPEKPSSVVSYGSNKRNQLLLLSKLNKASG
jgi:hypothetical protein